MYVCPNSFPRLNECILLFAMLRIGLLYIKLCIKETEYFLWLLYLHYMKGNLILLAFFAVLFFSAIHTTEAAMLYMDPNHTELNQGDTLKISIRLDTDEGECVNVVDGVITYSENIQPVDISRGSSIMSMWVEEPIINRSNHTITFAGGVPNGYCGRIAGDPRLTNVVLDLLFQSPGFVIGTAGNSTDATVSFSPQTQVLLNDGLGTEAQLALYGTAITLLKNNGEGIKNPWMDIVDADELPPEKFSISLEHTKNAYSDDYFIVFNTTDKQSGLDHYEVIEESMIEASLFHWGRVDAPWVEVRSPYVLKDQSLNSTIRVKAIDKAGNEYIAIYVPDEAQRTVAAQTKVLIAIIGTALAGLVFGGLIYMLIYFSRRKEKNNKENTDDTDLGVDEPELIL